MIIKNIGEAQTTPKEETYGMSTSDAWVGIPVGEEENQSLVDLEAISKLRARIGQEGVD